MERALREGGLWLCLGLGLLMFAALISHVPDAAEAGLAGSNLVGIAGAAFAGLAFALAGSASYLFPAAVIGFQRLVSRAVEGPRRLVLAGRGRARRRPGAGGGLRLRVA